MDLIGLEEELKQSGDSMSRPKHTSNMCHSKIIKAGKAICNTFLRKLWAFFKHYFAISCNFLKKFVIKQLSQICINPGAHSSNLADGWDCGLWCDSPLCPTAGLVPHQEVVCSLLSPYKCTDRVFEGPPCSSIIENICRRNESRACIHKSNSSSV